MVRAAKVSATLLMFCALLAPAPAAAQGKGNGNAFGHGKTATGGAAASAPSAASASSASVQQIEAAGTHIEGTGIRNFGSWLDDASIVAPGTGFMSLAVGYFKTEGFTEVDAPACDVGFGVHPRVQLGASIPVYHASQTGSPVVRGFGDLYLSSKIQLRDPAAGSGRFGMALIPIVEVLSVEPASGAGRVSFALPVSFELQRTGWRLYGSTGYFSRGALFASGAVEFAVSERAWVTASISESRSNKRDDLSEALGLSQVRTDVSGGLGIAIADGIAVFTSIGRTISRQDANSSKLVLSGGLAVNFATRP